MSFQKSLLNAPVVLGRLNYALAETGRLQMCAVYLRVHFPQIICFPEQIKSPAGHPKQRQAGAAGILGHTSPFFSLEVSTLDLQLPRPSFLSALAYANTFMKNFHKGIGMWPCIKYRLTLNSYCLCILSCLYLFYFLFIIYFFAAQGSVFVEEVWSWNVWPKRILWNFR